MANTYIFRHLIGCYKTTLISHYLSSLKIVPEKQRSALTNMELHET